MALWNTFVWSDGTLWADANQPIDTYTTFIDRKGYRVSLRITKTTTSTPAILNEIILHTASLEVGPRSQLPTGYEAFVDRNDNTQRISVRVTNTVTTENLTTESSEDLLTEDGENLIVEFGQAFILDQIHLLVNQRSRRQPTG